MTTDNYAPCPCGSGKKMKFCKCVDQPHEYDKIVRFIDGGQELAALDRINQLLSKTPNAAWLLAIKGELALSLREIETFKDTAHRFLKLKPDNPLALVMRSLVALMDQEPHENSVRYLLEGLAESREGIPRLGLTAMQLLLGQMRRSDKATLRFFWSRMLREFLQQAEIEDEKADDEPSSNDNLLTMGTGGFLKRTSSDPWAERANEVHALLSAFRYAQAETKLRSILRDYPDQPTLLSLLMHVQMVLLEQDAATITARKLSTLRDSAGFGDEQRGFYGAIAIEIEKGQPNTHNATRTRYCEIASDEAAREALAQLDGVIAIPDDPKVDAGVRQFVAQSVHDEVPAKQTYNVTVNKTLPTGGQYVAAAGTIALFGRQTDKPARALVVLFGTPDTAEIFDRIIAAIGPVADLPDPSAPREYAYLDLLERGRIYSEDGVLTSTLTLIDVSDAVIEDFVTTPFKVLGNSTPLEAAELEPKRAALLSLLTHLEGLHHLVVQPDTIPRIYERLQLTRPVANFENVSDLLNETSLVAITRFDIPSLSDEELGTAFSIAFGFQIRNMMTYVSKEILARPEAIGLKRLRAAALNICSGLAEDPEEALQLLDELEAVLAQDGHSPGTVVMRRFSILNELGRPEQASNSLIAAFAKYPTDPYLLSVMQYINERGRREKVEGKLDDVQLLSRMNRRTDIDEEDAVESGLVLPGHAQANDASKSKLWLPGS